MLIMLELVAVCRYASEKYQGFTMGMISKFVGNICQMPIYVIFPSPCVIINCFSFSVPVKDQFVLGS